MKKSKLFILGLLASASGIGTYMFLRKRKIERIVDSLKIKVVNIKNFDINLRELKADVYLQAINNTNENLNINTGVVKANQLRVYDNENSKQIAVSDLKTSKIDIPAGGIYYLPKVTVKIPLVTGAVIALNELTKKKSDFMKRLAFELDLQAMNYKKTLRF